MHAESGPTWPPLGAGPVTLCIGDGDPIELGQLHTDLVDPARDYAPCTADQAHLRRQLVERLLVAIHSLR